jgi:two-component system repressor protein LuxO
MAMHTGNDEKAAGRLMLIDQNDSCANTIAETLRHYLDQQTRITVVTGGLAAIQLLRGQRFDIILADIASLADLSEQNEVAMSRLVRSANKALVVALSDAGSVSAAVAAMRAGAHDYLAKPIDGPTIVAKLAELAQRHGRSRALRIEAVPHTGVAQFAGFVGASSAMQFVYEQIARIANSTAPVFITGESGTGKKLCAEALHAKGQRASSRLVCISCATIPRDLMESKLFGVARGAFTGTQHEGPGAAELADRGTLFLDEIGEMDLSLQSKLLRFLQTGTLSRVGETRVRHVDVRVVCATAANPMQLISDKKFREDLFYRLHVLPIHLPPLRQRPSDVMMLARHFLSRYATEEHKLFSGFSGEVAAMLTAAEWPGNVRQLQDLMRRLVVMFDGGEISSDMLASAHFDAFGEVRPAGFLRTGPQRPAILPMWQQEQRIIEDAIASFGGNVSLAAAALEISPSTIYRKRQGWADLAIAS